MKYLKSSLCLSLLFVLPGLSSGSQNGESFVPVQIHLFYETGCSDCQTVREEVLPELQTRFSDQYVLHEYDLMDEENLRKLIRYQNTFNSWVNEPVSVVIDEREMLCGVREIRSELLTLVEKCIAENRGPLPDNPLSSRVEPADEEVLQDRFETFAWPAMIAAGLLDGINPCAISTLVFFMSLLGVYKLGRQKLLVLGIFFCLASFLTYLALGFGLLHALHLFSGFEIFRGTVEWGMIAILLILSFFSFRDAFRFRNSRDGHDVTLQLSTRIKKQIHSIMRRGLGIRSLMGGGLLIGTTVTALESVCTGQVYVPTLVLILKNSAFSESRAWFYLLTYNLMFILPLILTFMAVYFGLQTKTLLSWSRKNVIPSKILLGIFFLLMALLIRLI